MDLKIGIHPDTLAAMEGQFWPVVMVYLDWPDDPVWVHSGEGILAWGGFDWTGIDRMGGISLPGDGTGLQTGRGSVTLGGSSEKIYDLLDASPVAQGRAVDVHLGVATARAGTEFIGEPFLAWRGFMAEAVESETWTGNVTRFEINVALDTGPHPRAQGTAIHNEADQRRRDPDPVFTDSSGRHLRGVVLRSKNTVARQ